MINLLNAIVGGSWLLWKKSKSFQVKWQIIPRKPNSNQSNRFLSLHVISVKSGEMPIDSARSTFLLLYQHTPLVETWRKVPFSPHEVIESSPSWAQTWPEPTYMRAINDFFWQKNVIFLFTNLYVSCALFFFSCPLLR